MKKTMALFLCAALFLAVLLPAGFSFAFVRTEAGEAALLQEGEFDLVTVEESHYADLPLRVQNGVEQAIYLQLKSVASQVNIASYNIPTADAGDLYAKVINAHPDLFYVSSSYQVSYYPATGTIAAFLPSYAEMDESIEEAQAIFEEGVAKALTCVDDKMTDEQKAVVLHDYICSEAQYPVLAYNSEGQLTNDRDIWHSAYGFFKNKEVVCAGFTLVYSYLLSQLGIQSEYVSSDAMQHAWNRVKLNNHWYNVDLTYDNHDNAQGVNTFGSVSHVHLLKSDSYFAAESGTYHYGGTTYEDTTADDTAYDNAFWNDLPCARIYVVNGDYYYIKQAGNFFRFYLKRRGSDNTETNIGTVFSTASLGYNTKVYDQNNVLQTISHSDLLGRLAYLDNRFYVVSSTAIYSLTLDGRRYDIASDLANYCNGLGVDGDANLIYQTYDDSTVVDTLDKAAYFTEHISAFDNDSNYHNYPDINLDGYVNAKDHALILQQ